MLPTNLNLTPDDDLDNRLSEYTGQDTLIDKMTRKSKAKPAIDDMSFQAEVSKNWWIYFLLGVSSIFTATLGIYMGLSPYKTPEGLTFYTDLPHLLLALVYAIAFVTVTEFAFGLAKWLFFTREEKNVWQQSSMVLMMLIAGISILGTGIAGGLVIASNISFLTDFIEVPHQAQVWVIIAIPTLIISYAVLGTVYISSSEEAKAKRIVREQKRKNDLNNETRMQIIRGWGQEQVEREQAKIFIELVKKGKIDAATAKGAIMAGLTLGQLEKQLKKDLDGNGIVGNNEDSKGFSGNGKLPVMASDEPDFPPSRQ